jgi:hypothetical protein
MRTGTSTGGHPEWSPRYRRKRSRQKAAEEKRWRELNGPVVSYRLDDVRHEDEDLNHDDRSVEPTGE